MCDVCGAARLRLSGCQICVAVLVAALAWQHCALGGQASSTQHQLAIINCQLCTNSPHSATRSLSFINPSRLLACSRTSSFSLQHHSPLRVSSTTRIHTSILGSSPSSLPPPPHPFTSPATSFRIDTSSRQIKTSQPPSCLRFLAPQSEHRNLCIGRPSQHRTPSTQPSRPPSLDRPCAILASRCSSDTKQLQSSRLSRILFAPCISHHHVTNRRLLAQGVQLSITIPVPSSQPHRRHRRRFWLWRWPFLP